MFTSTMTLEEPISPRLLSSTSALSPSHTSRSPNVARIYKQTSHLFLTRRVKEALETIEPLLQKSGTSGEERDDEEGQTPEEEQNIAAPIATASRGARVKVWSLYMSLLNSIAEMGYEEGKGMFGAARWKELTSKARDGSIWADVVDEGYNGAEGEVDAEVVANLATLLLAHAPSQRLTQQRLETYLSASSAPSLDVASHMERRKLPQQSQSNGTSTPRDLNSRLKILEIYTLHVLPRNQEWEYAREFIAMSEVLDDERREAFLQALQTIQDESTVDTKREEQLQNERRQQLEAARQRDADARREEQARLDLEEKRRKQPEKVQTTEGDYGVDRSTIGEQSKPGAAAPNGPRHASKPSNPRSKTPASRPTSNASAKNNTSRSPTMYRRAFLAVGNLQRTVLAMGQNVKTHPMVLLRFLAFLVAFVMAFSRRDVRDRLTRLRDGSWDKLKQTVGMGVKVSYI